MNRLEEIDKMITELAAEREELVKQGNMKSRDEMEKHFQDAIKLMGKYVKWSDASDILRLGKVVDVKMVSRVELELEQFCTVYSDGTFVTSNDEEMIYAAYSSREGKVWFKEDLEIIDPTEYANTIYDAVGKFVNLD